MECPWKVLRKKAFHRWHRSFEEFQGTVSPELDHLADYQEELATLTVEKFQRHLKAELIAT
jgi:hypothetical protein